MVRLAARYQGSVGFVGCDERLMRRKARLLSVVTKGWLPASHAEVPWSISTTELSNDQMTL